MYALLYNDHESIASLAKLNYKRAEHPEFERTSINRKYYSNYNSDNIKGVEQEIKRYGVNYRDQFNLTPLLAATENGSVKVVSFLLAQNADTDVLDNNGRNPFRIVINKLYFSPKSSAKLEDIFSQMLTDNIRVSVNDRMVKIANGKMEYFLLNIFMTLQDAVISGNRMKWEGNGVMAGDLEKIVANYPELIMPDYRKRKTYISSILAKNETDSKNPYNNALFIRVERGYYCINPGLSVLVDDKWINAYEFTGLKMAKKLTEEEKEDRLIERLRIDNEETRKYNPEYATEQDQYLLDYKRRMAELRKEKLKLVNIKSEPKSSEKPEPKVVLREFVIDTETREQWEREAERKRILEEKHRKDIEDMMKKKPL
jgi:hypothetical protein